MTQNPKHAGFCTYYPTRFLIGCITSHIRSRKLKYQSQTWAGLCLPLAEKWKSLWIPLTLLNPVLHSLCHNLSINFWHWGQPIKAVNTESEKWNPEPWLQCTVASGELGRVNTHPWCSGSRENPEVAGEHIHFILSYLYLMLLFNRFRFIMSLNAQFRSGKIWRETSLD